MKVFIYKIGSKLFFITAPDQEYAEKMINKRFSKSSTLSSLSYLTRFIQEIPTQYTIITEIKKEF